MYQGDRPDFTDKVNLIAQRQRRSQGQLATDVVARSSYADTGDLVAGLGPGQPGRVPVGDEGSVLTSSPHDRGGLRWAEVPLVPTVGVGAIAIVTAKNWESVAPRPLGPLGELLVSVGQGVNGNTDGRYCFGDVFNLDVNDPSGHWFEGFSDGSVRVLLDSVLFVKVIASVQIRHSGGLVLPDRFCYAGFGQAIDQLASPYQSGWGMGCLVRPDLQNPVQRDNTWEGRPGGFPGEFSDPDGHSDYAFDSASDVVLVCAGTEIFPRYRFVSTATTGTPTAVSVALMVHRLGDWSPDLPPADTLESFVFCSGFLD